MDDPRDYVNYLEAEEAAKDPDTERGIYDKFAVKRLGDEEGKHSNCTYFVLDLAHDPFAIPAINAYADACEEDYPLLADDLRGWVNGD